MTKPIPSGIALTGTGLDAIILAIANDDGLNTALNPKNDAAKAEKIAEGTHAAADMNILLDAAIKATGVAADGTISSDDVVKINSYLRSDPDMLARFTGDYGSDANGVDTGYHQIMCNGGVTQFRGHNVFNKVADGIYHAAFEIQGDHFLNDDGSAGVSVQSVANTLNYFYLGKNEISGTSGNDVLRSGASDTLFSGSENETFKAGAGNDVVIAGDGNDVVFGDAGNDRLSGGNGNDKLIGGAGADMLEGGAGSDTFMFAKGDSGLRLKDMDKIADFHSGEDKIDLSGLGHSHFAGSQFDGHGPEVIQRGAFLLIDHTGDGRPDMAIQLLGNAHLLAGDFVFA